MVDVHVVESVPDADVARLWSVYASVFDDQPSHRAWREAVWDRHSGREGFRLALAHRGVDLVGFAYGYTGRHGQWWTDRARECLAPEVAERWLGGHFEVVSPGVLDDARRQGVGGRLLQALLQDVPHDRWLLMTTADAADPARRLYESEGWE